MDVQTLLIKMQDKLEENHADLVKKVDDGFKALTTAASEHELSDTRLFSAIDNRLVIVENTRRTIRWLGTTVLVALIGAFADFVFVHLPKLLGGHP